MRKLRWPVILFDLDGTLINTVDLIVQSFQHTYRQVLGEDLPSAQARSWMGRTLPDVFGHHGPELAQRLDDTFVEFNLSNMERLQTRYDGVSEAVLMLHDIGAQLGVVTSKRTRGAELSMRGAGLADVVPLLATLGDTEHHKPHPDPLLRAMEKLDAQPDECVYVGDAVVDVQAAKNAGVSSVAVTWGAGETDALLDARPDFCVNTADEMLRALAS